MSERLNHPETLYPVTKHIDGSCTCTKYGLRVAFTEEDTEPVTTIHIILECLDKPNMPGLAYIHRDIATWAVPLLEIVSEVDDMHDQRRAKIRDELRRLADQIDPTREEPTDDLDDYARQTFHDWALGRSGPPMAPIMDRLAAMHDPLPDDLVDLLGCGTYADIIARIDAASSDDHVPVDELAVRMKHSMMPTREWLAAYTKVTGSTDYSPRAIFAAVIEDTDNGHKIKEAHAEIVQALLGHRAGADGPMTLIQLRARNLLHGGHPFTLKERSVLTRIMLTRRPGDEAILAEFDRFLARDEDYHSS